MIMEQMLNQINKKDNNKNLDLKGHQQKIPKPISNQKLFSKLQS